MVKLMLLNLLNPVSTETSHPLIVPGALNA